MEMEFKPGHLPPEFLAPNLHAMLPRKKLLEEVTNKYVLD